MATQQTAPLPLQKDDLAGLLDDLRALRARLEQVQAELDGIQAVMDVMFLQSTNGLMISRLADGLILRVNPALEDMTGYTKNELLLHSALQLGLLTEGKRNAMLQVLQNGGVIENLETVFRTKSGGELYCLTSGNLVTYQGQACLFSMHTNNTATRQSEQALKASQDSLRASLADSEIQRKRLLVLNKINLAITNHTNLRTLVQTVLTYITETIDIHAVVLTLLSEEGSLLEVAASTGFHEMQHLEFPDWLVDLSAEGYYERRVVYHPPFQARLATRQAGLLAGGFASCASLPLVIKNEIRGTLAVFSRRELVFDPGWKEFLESLAVQVSVAIDNAGLIYQTQLANMELTAAYEATIEGWAQALELRDKETYGHSNRVTGLTLALAREMNLPASELVHLRRGVLLHDIGKMGVPDAILLKTEALSEVEWARMREHPALAYQLLATIPVLRPALDVPYCHHERWDGSGYPRGLKGTNIPLTARLFTVVDVWDALTSNRTYRPAWSQQTALDYLKDNAGVLFDPDVVDAFTGLLNQPGALDSIGNSTGSPGI